MSLNTPRSHKQNQGIGLWDRYPVALVIGALLGMSGAPLIQKVAGKYGNATQAIVAPAMPFDDTLGEKIVLEMDYAHLPETEQHSIQRLINPGNREHYKLIQQGTVNNIEFKRWEGSGFTYIEYYDHSGKVVAREDVSKGRVTEKTMLDNDKKNTKVRGARLVFFDSENKPFGGYDLYGSKTDPKSYYHTLAHHLFKGKTGADFSEMLHIFSELGFTYVSDRENGIFKTLFKGDESVHSADESVLRAQIHDAGEKNNLHGMLFGDCDDFAEIAKRLIRCSHGEDYPAISIHVPQHATTLYEEPGTSTLCTVCTMGGVYRGGVRFGDRSQSGKTEKEIPKGEEINRVLERYFDGATSQETMKIHMPKETQYPLKNSGELWINVLLGKGERGQEFIRWRDFTKEKFPHFYREKLKPKEKK